MEPIPHRLAGRARAGALAAAAALLVAVAVSPPAPAAPGGGATASGAAKAVAIRSFAFHPGTLRVSRGAKVVFSNADRVSHTATDKGVFDTGLIKRGHSAAVVFKRKGVFSYICTIHPWMHGKVVVG